MFGTGHSPFPKWNSFQITWNSLQSENTLLCGSHLHSKLVLLCCWLLPVPLAQGVLAELPRLGALCARRVNSSAGTEPYAPAIWEAPGLSWSSRLCCRLQGVAAASTALLGCVKGGDVLLQNTLCLHNLLAFTDNVTSPLKCCKITTNFGKCLADRKLELYRSSWISLFSGLDLCDAIKSVLITHAAYPAGLVVLCSLYGHNYCENVISR